MSKGTLLAPRQFGFGKARAISTPCFYIFTLIQNVPFWAGLSQASSLVSELVDQETLLKRMNFGPSCSS